MTERKTEKDPLLSAFLNFGFRSDSLVKSQFGDSTDYPIPELLLIPKMIKATVNFQSTTRQDASMRVSIQPNNEFQFEFIHLPPLHRLNSEHSDSSAQILKCLKKTSTHQVTCSQEKISEEPRIIMIDGIPLEDYWQFLNSKTVCFTTLIRFKLVGN